MDNPVSSLFQDGDLKLSNSRCNEEEEDLEDQHRRNEELQNLLMAKLDDFNYDESTINSSNNVSAVSLDDQNKYRNADQYEQLKVLYDVRLKELSALRNEYDTFKKEELREKELLKRKIITYEAEIQQTKVLLKNTNELLVEKSSIINELRVTSDSHREQLRNYEEAIENYRLEISTYQSTINDLQLQIQRDINPFHLEDKRFNSTELQKSYQDKIDRLESLLEEQTKAAKIHEKEKLLANSEIQNLLKQEIDYKNTIDALTKNFDSAQKQCEDLINVIDLLTKENRQLQDRVDAVYKKNSLDQSINICHENNSLGDNVEKLKKMLLDKSIHIDSLNSKLRCYENDIKELLEYRQIKNDVYKKDFQQCDNKDHTKSLLVMQTDLQNYRRTIEDKNQQILTLNSTNRNLLEKMEEMLSQTRNDIEKFSHKYNLPQLEKMTEDLKEAEKKIKELEEKLNRSEERRLSLVQKIQKSEKNAEKDIRTELDLLKLKSDKERNDFDNHLKKLQKDLDDSASEIDSLKQYIDKLLNENSRLISQHKEHDENMKAEKHDLQNKLKMLEETVEELTNFKTLSDGEKCTYQSQVTNYKNRLEDTEKILESVKIELQEITATLKDKEKLIEDLRHSLKNSETEIFELKGQLSSKDAALKLAADTKNELLQLLEHTNLELETAKKNIFNLQNQEADVTEKNVRRNLERELQEIDQQRSLNVEDNQAVDILTIEIRLREEIQEEYFKKLKEIEKKYKKMCTSSNELYKEQAEIVKNQENKFREYIATIVNECTVKINALEGDREDLIKQLDNMRNEFKNYKTRANQREKIIENMFREENKKNSENWKSWAQEFVNNCLKIETANKRSCDGILFKMKAIDSEVAAIEKSYNDKIKKYVRNCKI
nr:uncharacterized protein PFB0765w-like [Leptinotarsa decemlineata]